MTRSRRIWLFALCVAGSFLQGLIALKVYAVGIWIIWFGIVGAVPFMLLNGVHGDMKGWPGIVGGVLYVLTNGAVYYGVVMLIIRRRAARRGTPSSLN
jgi:hypothetical protein